MSLQEFFLMRAAQEHQNALNSDNTGIVLQSLAQGVAQGIQAEQQRVQAERDAERKSKMAIEQYRAMTRGGTTIGGGTLIPKLTMKDGAFELSASTPSESEMKSQFELDNEQSFIKDVQSGVSADTLYTRYPGKTSDIDNLRKAGAIRSADVQIESVSGKPITISEKGGATAATDANGKALELIPSGYDELGRIKGWDVVKPSQSQQNRDVETRELSAQIENLTDLFVRARREASSVEGFGKPGPEGRVANVEAIIRGKAGLSPTVNVFTDRLPAFATLTAKAAGEVRPTDEDIRRFSKALMNLGMNDAENAIQLEQVIKDVRSKGHSVLWAEPIIKAFEQETGVKVNIDFGTKTGKPVTTPINVGKYKVRSVTQ